jgi:hypothetical protein
MAVSQPDARSKGPMAEVRRKASWLGRMDAWPQAALRAAQMAPSPGAV